MARGGAAAVTSSRPARARSLVMYNYDGKPVARYHLENAWPSKMEIGALKAGSTEVLMETVTIVCERHPAGRPVTAAVAADARGAAHGVPVRAPARYVDEHGVGAPRGRHAAGHGRRRDLRRRPIPGCAQNPAYLTVLLLERTVTRLGTLAEVDTYVIENLFASDLAFLQDLYRRINQDGHTEAEVTCPSCGTRLRGRHRPVMRRGDHDVRVRPAVGGGRVRRLLPALVVGPDPRPGAPDPRPDRSRRSARSTYSSAATEVGEPDAMGVPVEPAAGHRPAGSAARAHRSPVCPQWWATGVAVGAGAASHRPRRRADPGTARVAGGQRYPQPAAPQPVRAAGADAARPGPGPRHGRADGR